MFSYVTFKTLYEKIQNIFDFNMICIECCVQPWMSVNTIQDDINVTSELFSVEFYVTPGFKIRRPNLGFMFWGFICSRTNSEDCELFYCVAVHKTLDPASFFILDKSLFHADAAYRQWCIGSSSTYVRLYNLECIGHTNNLNRI